MRRMSVAIISGSAGLVGSEASLLFGKLGMHVVGIDNDMRKFFFGEEASTAWNVQRLQDRLGAHYSHLELDIRDRDGLDAVFAKYGKDIALVLHAAAQPSHDWAAREPFTDFDINAVGTLNMLESTRAHCVDAAFIFTSTNKVYGDTPNRLPLVEQESRWEIDPSHTYSGGIREDMSIDACLHSIFGASKLAADVMVQEYGRYFGMNTACFRGGTLTGPMHSATQLHGFLAYVMRCAMTDTPYTVFGYKGKQVRDAIHSEDLTQAFHAFFNAPTSGETYNIGGGRFSNCSVIEAIQLTERITGREMRWSYTEENRVGDHIWWIGDNGKFAAQYPEWTMQYDVERILQETFDANQERWTT
jgi:CDP-paratose 2-epimerase